MKIKIEYININGEGISIVDGKKYCMRGVLPLETVDAVVEKDKDNFALCYVDKMLEESNCRVTPPCPYQSICGGCDLMMASEEMQVNIKLDTIARFFGDIFSGLIPFHHSSNLLHYRNKVSFAVEDGRVGLVKANSREIVEIDKCIVSQDEINTVFAIFKDYLSLLKEKAECINHLVVRTLSHKVMVTIVASKKPIYLEKFTNLLQKTFFEDFGLYVNYNKRNSKDILSDKWQHISGIDCLKCTIMGLQSYIYPHSFLQINDVVRDEMYQFVSGYINNEIIVEGYSGAGLLSAIMAKSAQQVYSVEINKDATKSAEKLKKANKIDNIENINGDFSTIFPKLCQDVSATTLVLDPPRNGLSKQVLDAVLSSNIQRIIYISCSPYTLKQNIGYLKDSYKVESIDLFDLFPQTSHIESVVILKKKIL